MFLELGSALALAAPPAEPVAQFAPDERVESVALAAERVYATIERSDRSVRLVELANRRRRTLFAARVPKAPEPPSDFYELGGIGQSLHVDASRSAIALRRTVTATWHPRCLRAGCRAASDVEVLLTELYAGLRGQRLRLLMRVDHRADPCAPGPTLVSVSANLIAYALASPWPNSCDVTSTVIVGAVRTRVESTRTVAHVDDAVTALDIAGRYVAWTTRERASFNVVDRRTGMRMTRVLREAPRASFGVAVRGDGTVAYTTTMFRNGCGFDALAVAPFAGRARLTYVPTTAIVGFAGTTLVHFGSRNCNGTGLRIAATTATGATSVLRRVPAAPEGIDADGRFVVYGLPLRPGPSRTPTVIYRQRVA